MTDETDVTAAGETIAAPEQLHAYALDDGEDYPQTAAGRARWALPLAALLVAVAALIAAGAIGVRALNDANTPIVTVTRPTITTRAPALTQPDQDSAFLMDLDAHGGHLLGAYAAVHNAKKVCYLTTNHLGTREQMITALLAAGDDGIDRALVEMFIDIAIAHYCPGAQLA
ncbi:DUF732 domain-containing protein [Mycobacterium sp. 3-98]|uniref:DUF732 domain-containing protein n=1 Tax=Mycobacterium sp. 3-98 TaxID=3042317 RepID=UPI002DDAC910|nr:DUF732 domain-containing protein [Mycobacterium sp. 3-98]WSE45580.1 DUF732 domain-containing protein [Mycobacterium sp. 3-98]